MIEDLTFTSDFGEGSEYVAAVKARIYRINPQVRVTDVAHALSPFTVKEAAAVVAAVAPLFPRAVHLVVVDPGVGSARRALMLRARLGHWFVGPDNGVLLLAAERLGGVEEAWEIVPEAFAHYEIAPTFHGRDIFGPAAALLSLDEDPSEIGRPLSVEELVPLKLLRKVKEDSAAAEVISIDRFGNARLSLWAHEVEKFLEEERLLLCFARGSREVRCLPYFSLAEPGEVFVGADSSGFVEIAAREANAAKILNLTVGSTVELKKLMEEE